MLSFEHSVIEQPKDVKIKLKPHQLASIYRMNTIEAEDGIKLHLTEEEIRKYCLTDNNKGDLMLSNEDYDEESESETDTETDSENDSDDDLNNNPKNNIVKEVEKKEKNHEIDTLVENIYKDSIKDKHSVVLRTNMGLLSDSVGAGKTYTTLGFISQVKNNHKKIISSNMINPILSNIFTIERKNTGINLVIVPHSIIEQWYQSVKNTNLGYYIIEKQANITKLLSNTRQNYTEIIKDAKKDIEDLKITSLKNFEKITAPLVRQIKEANINPQRCAFCYRERYSYCGCYYFDSIGKHTRDSELDHYQRTLKTLATKLPHLVPLRDAICDKLVEYLGKMDVLNKKITSTTKLLSEVNYKEEIKTIQTKYDVIICSYTQYPSFYETFKKINFDRIFIDEAHTFPKKILHEHGFLWFITATPNINNNYKTKQYQMRYIMQNEQINRFITVKTTQEFKESSFKLPPYKKIIIICSSSVKLDGVCNDKTQKLLNTGNISQLMTELNINTKNKFDLIEFIKKDHVLELTEVEKKIYFYTEISKDKNKLEKYTDKAKTIKEKIASLEDKISNASQSRCVICCGDVDEDKIVVTCCKNFFCSGCILSWLNMSSNKCPLCMTAIDLKNLISINEKINDIAVKLQQIFKEKAILDLIKSKPKGKFLVFSDFFDCNTTIENLLKINNITHTTISGTCNTINKKIEDFNSGNISVLLINSKFFASGMNLQAATDVIFTHKVNNTTETQGIGRAQRFGRKDSLNVYYMYDLADQYNEKEFSEITNTTIPEGFETYKQKYCK